MKSEEAGWQVVEQLTGGVNLSRFVILANLVVYTLLDNVIKPQDLGYAVTYTNKYFYQKLKLVGKYSSTK